MMEDQHNDGAINQILENQIVIMAVLHNLLHAPGVHNEILHKDKYQSGYKVLDERITKTEAQLKLRKTDR